MGRESGAWAGLRARLLTAGVHPVRLTERFTAGVPDVLWVVKATGQTGLVELKAVDRFPVKGGAFAPGVSIAQSVWIRGWVEAGGLSGVLCRVSLARQWVYWPGRSDTQWAKLIQVDALKLDHRVYPDPLDITQLVSDMTDTEAHY